MRENVQRLAIIGVLTLQVPSASRDVLEVPSREFPTIQSAIDAAPEGAVIRILPGIYRLTEPLWVRDKRQLTLLGSGDSGEGRTELAGPIPDVRDRVADPELDRGVVNLVNSSAEIGHMLLRGFDAGIVARQTGATERRHLTSKLTNLVIRDASRGIHWKAPGKLTVSNVRISDVAWNGISLAPTPAQAAIGTLLKFDLESVIISDFGNAGIVYINDPGVCDDDHTVKNATLIGGGGPAVLAIRSGVCIRDSYIAIPRVAAVVALSAAVLVENTKIFFPVPSLAGEWGTGIVASALSSGGRS